MGRIRGHYEWDDDDLTPGKKREGGLHQNLFDNDGHLKGNARFVPDDGDDEPDPLHVTETVYVHVEERRRSQLEEDIQDIVRIAVDRLLDRGVEWARPIVSGWWHETARPYAAAKRDSFRSRRPRRTGQTSALSSAEPEVADADSLPTSAVQGQRPRMSEAEAKARLLAALAARAYGEEQVRLVADADIIDGSTMEELERSLAELPAEQLRELVLAMATNPALLTEDSLAGLASIIGSSAVPELRPGHNEFS